MKHREKARSASGSYFTRLPRNEPVPRPPDETLNIAGIGKMERFGANVVLSSNRTPEEQDALMKGYAARHSEVCAEIDKKVERCIAIVRKYAPTALLKMAFTEFSAAMLGIKSEAEVAGGQMLAARMIDYVQSIVAGDVAGGVDTAPDEVSWLELRSHVHDMYQLLLIDWPRCESARRKLLAADDPATDKFLIPLLMYWISVRGQRYHVHEGERLAELLGPHDAELRERFGVGASYVANAVECILRKLTGGLVSAVRTVSSVRNEAFSEENMSGYDGGEQLNTAETARALVQRTGRGDELHNALEDLVGLRLFDVTKLLPRRLLAHLALQPGDDTAFLAAGEHRGWPTRASATRQRPILQMGESFYVFDPFFADGIYRAIERAIVRENPAYRESWNYGQKTTTERLAVETLRQMVPGAVVLSGVEYQVDDGGNRKWVECDAVLLVDTLLLAVEVKAGKATDKSPFSDLRSFAKSVGVLLHEPANQADRLVRALEAAGELALYTRGRKQCTVVSCDSYKDRFRCAVTADQMATTAASFQHDEYIRAAGYGKISPTWCVSIDDLYVLRDVFSSAALFFHYLQCRIDAFSIAELTWVDELDHLGLYLAKSRYGEWVRTLRMDVVAFSGYRAPIDEYFGAIWAGDEDKQSPAQVMPARLLELIRVLEASARPGFLRAAAALLDMDGASREAVADGVSVSIARMMAGAAFSPILTFRSGATTLFVSLATSHLFDKVRAANRLHVRGQAVDIKEATHLECLVDSPGVLVKSFIDSIDLTSMTAEDEAQLRAVQRETATRRVDDALQRGLKLGRNSLCPCASGRKYKKCCLNK